jgi:hypothetical protein
MRIPLAPVMSLITLCNCRFIWVSAFCIIRMHAEAACTNDSRCRPMLRIAQISSAGRNEPCSSPTEWRYCSHCASLTSVFRPGTCLTCCALTSSTSNPSLSKSSYSGIQYTPVDSIATVFTPTVRNHRTIAFRSRVKVSKVRTGSSSFPGPTATWISVAPISIPAASSRITGNCTAFTSFFFRFCFIFIWDIGLSFCCVPTAWVSGSIHSSNRDRFHAPAKKPGSTSRHHWLGRHTQNQARQRAS